ncbi:hypothetical protein [Gilvimarinus sp. 1_MG-2023]|uniref:hypothetical protein n=1 Tax=Gilvimarinus sp. 1_MG-2023 TaxID=3062638 RepID=UPI0026E35284|nr:hypothetical protein [Gilvimarinus sp. 1_MG-2023]MDO6747257.1 hypothetical protein [Gilvimarinus sp. 1_MG-2023]
MAATFFGQYLQIKGIISQSQLSDALSLQHANNKTLGQLAADMGYLSSDQSSQILLRQRHSDHLFGELAQSLGWLNDQHIQQLLARQQAEHLTLGAALIELQCLTESQLQHLLADYHYWNLRNQRECNKRVAQSHLAPQVEGFSFLLERQLQREFGLIAQTNYVFPKHPSAWPEWSWVMKGGVADSLVGIAAAPAFVQTLQERRLSWQGSRLASIDNTNRLQSNESTSSIVGAAVAAEDFFDRLLQQLTEDIEQSSLEVLNAHKDTPPASVDSLCVGYSVEGKPLQVYFSAA